MNAKELHDLYAPLWEKVPEIRPGLHIDGIESLWLVYGDEYDDFGWSTDVESGPDGDDLVIPSVAAALCRVAVEDWLRNTETSRTMDGRPNRDLHTTLTEDGDEGNVFVFVDWPQQWAADGLDVIDDTAMFGGPTIHHALVAAALAVAGEKP